MNKEEAIEAMKDGKKITHQYFAKDEWITMNWRGEIETEEGYKHDFAEYWHYRQDEHWQEGYSIFVEPMVKKKSWSEFSSSGLLLIINQLLHIFGWALVFEFDNGEVKAVFPARVKFRGFDNKDVEANYIKVSQYMKDNAEILLNEASVTDASEK
jgi:hypothetical protein